MCDTFVALGNSTADGSVIFGKNSDREPNEAHEVRVFPASDHPEGSQVQCTYISIPQVAHTYAVLLAKPFWMWGAEMGINAHGVTIGNEAIFTRVPYETENGLIGMDLLRLALERSTTAQDALKTITQLLERYGQGGNCGFTHPFYYHNSFIIADPQQAWVLETVGRQWVAERVQDVRSISNAATIGSTWDLASNDLIRFAIDQRLCKNGNNFNFARTYSDIPYTTLSNARSRQACTTHSLQGERASISAYRAAQFLRMHGLNQPAKLNPDRGLIGSTVCMHAGAGPVRGSQSVGSMVAQLTPSLQTCWVTATSAPCTGIFKPVWIDAGIPLEEPSPVGTFDPRCLWWRHEKLHRLVLKDYDSRIAAYAAERDRLEMRFFEDESCNLKDLDARRIYSAACFQQAETATSDWIARVRAVPTRRAPRFYYSSAWKGFSEQADFHRNEI